jgi:hypoxanthine phosphoribosyltransferase
MSYHSSNLIEDVDRVLIDEESLQARIGEIAKQIEADYAEDDDILLICVLKGGFIFLADLSRAIKRPHQLDFMGISSYGRGTESSGAVRIVLELKEDIIGRHVLIVEDIIDSGNTLDYMRRNLLARSPASLRICSLLDKPSRREMSHDRPPQLTQAATPEPSTRAFRCPSCRRVRSRLSCGPAR